MMLCLPDPEFFLPTFADLQKRGSVAVRREVARRLGKVSIQGAKNILAGALADPDPEVCFEASMSLRKVDPARPGPGAALARVVNMAAPTDLKLRALRTLARWRFKPAAPALIQALHDEDYLVRWRAAKTFQRLKEDMTAEKGEKRHTGK